MGTRPTASKKKDRRSKLIKAVKAFLAIGLGLTAVFLPAGTFAWIEAWVFIGLYLVAVLLLVLWLRRHDPALLRERSDKKKEGKSWDKVLLSIYTSLFILMLVCAGLDAVRFRWTIVPVWLKIAAYALLLPVMLLFFLVYRENTFASEVVRIQKDRGHRVIATGPYRVVRHPMYTGIVVLMSLIPLVLGSFVALIFSGLIVAVFFVRTYLEDRTLQRELPGYKAYVKKVRYRLIPFLW